jgi:uncharacterized membrane protein required for colicin V production
MTVFAGNSGLFSALIDIAIFFVIIMSAIMAARRGVLYSILNLFKSIICIVIAAWSAKPLANLVSDTTMVGEKLSNALSKTVYDEIPEILPKSLRQWTSAEIAGKADEWTKILLIVIMFFISLITVSILVRIILSFFDGAKHKHVGLLNGFLGFLFGILRGIIIISLIMLVISISAPFAKPDESSLIYFIRMSIIGRVFYEHNPILYMLYMMF